MKRATLGLSEEHTPTSTEWFGMKVGCWHWFVFRKFWAHSAKLSCWPWTVKTFKTNHHKNQHQPANCQRAAVCHVLLFFCQLQVRQIVADIFFGIQISRFVAQYLSICHSFCNTRKTLKDDQLQWGCVSCSPWGSVTEEDPEFLREALLRSMPNAVQCGSCHYGPIDHVARLQLMWMAMAKTWKQKKNDDCLQPLGCCVKLEYLRDMLIEICTCQRMSLWISIVAWSRDG